MPINIERIPDEPILVFTYVGHVTVDDVATTWNHSERFGELTHEPIFIINDLTAAEVHFSDMIAAMRLSQERLGEQANNTGTIIFVGEGLMVENIIRGMKNSETESLHIDSYGTIEAALKHVYFDIASQR